MSNEVFPTLPGLEWNVARTPNAPPVQKRSTPSRREFRARDSSLILYDYTLSYEFLRAAVAFAEWQSLASFFEEMGGSFDTFLFTDPDDYAVSAYQFGTGNGAALTFPLKRPFGSVVGYVTDPAWAIVSVNGVVSNHISANSGFETDSNADGMSDAWVSYGSGTTGVISASRPAGNGSTFAQRIAAANLGTNLTDRAGLRVESAVQAFPGRQYTFAADLKDSGAGTPTHEIYLDWYDSAGVYADSASATFSPSASFVRRSLTATAPANAASAYLYIWMRTRTASAGASSIDIDNVKFEPGTTATTYTSQGVSIAPTTGVVTFNPQPDDGAPIVWTGEFYRRLRFVRDQLEFRKFMADFWDARKVELTQRPA